MLKEVAAIPSVTPFQKASLNRGSQENWHRKVSSRTQSHCSRAPQSSAGRFTVATADYPAFSSVDPKSLLPSQAAKELRRIAHGARKGRMQDRLHKARQRRVKELITALRPRQKDAASLDAEGKANALWALSMLGGRYLFQAEMDLILQGVEIEDEDFTGGEIVDIAWSLANAAHWSPRLDDLAAALLLHGGLTPLLPAQVTSLLWSFATLNHASADFLSDISALPQGESFTLPQLCTCCWSACVLQQEASPGFDILWSELASPARQQPQLDSRLAAQLVQVARSLQSSSRETDGNAELLQRAKDLWNLTLTQKGHVQVSAQQQEVGRALIGMGVSYVTEDTSTGYAVDIAIPNLRIAVEIDGPSHFARTDMQRPLGPTALKRRQLGQMGWHVFSITLHDWQSPGRAEARLQELRRLIEKRQRDHSNQQSDDF